MRAINWERKPFEFGGLNNIVYLAYAYALVDRHVQGQIGHSVLAFQRRDRPVWELPGGPQSPRLVGMSAVTPACAKIISQPVMPRANDHRRDEFFFTQMLYMDSFTDDEKVVHELTMHASVATYRASLPRGQDDAVCQSVVAADIEKIAWVPAYRFRKENVHPLCWPALALYLRLERDQFPL